MSKFRQIKNIVFPKSRNTNKVETVQNKLTAGKLSTTIRKHEVSS